MKKNKFWSQAVRQLTPYIPGEQPISSNLIKLNTNENPYAPSPKVREAIISELDEIFFIFSLFFNTIIFFLCPLFFIFFFFYSSFISNFTLFLL